MCLCSAEQSFFTLGRKKFPYRRTQVARGNVVQKKDARLRSAFFFTQIQSEARVTRGSFFSNLVTVEVSHSVGQNRKTGALSLIVSIVLTISIGGDDIEDIGDEELDRAIESSVLCEGD